MHRLLILSFALLFAVNAFSQERRHAISIQYGPSRARVWHDTNLGRGKQRSIFANTAFLEYKLALWNPKIKLHLGVNYMERGSKLIKEKSDGRTSTSTEQFRFIGSKTSFSYDFGKYNCEIGVLINKTLYWEIYYNGVPSNMANLDSQPSVTSSPFLAFGRDFELKPRLDFCTKAFFTSALYLNRWNYGVSVGLEYQFGKDINSK